MRTDATDVLDLNGFQVTWQRVEWHSEDSDDYDDAYGYVDRYGDLLDTDWTPHCLMTLKEAFDVVGENLTGYLMDVEPSSTDIDDVRSVTLYYGNEGKSISIHLPKGLDQQQRRDVLSAIAVEYGVEHLIR